MLGIQTRGRRMVGADETTKLWRPPVFYFMLSFSLSLSVCYFLDHFFDIFQINVHSHRDIEQISISKRNIFRNLIEKWWSKFDCKLQICNWRGKCCMQKTPCFWKDFNLVLMAIHSLFFFIFVLSIQLIVHINFADDWIRTTDLWGWKRPLYLLHHNHYQDL